VTEPPVRKKLTAVLETSGLCYPNRIARLFFLAMEDVMGKGGLNQILNLAGLESFIDEPPPDNLARQFDFTYLAAICEALEVTYGERGGRSIALRMGRSVFARGLKSFGAMSGVTDPAFVALPLDTRMELGLGALVAIFNTFTDQESSVQNRGDYYEFSTDVSPMAWGRQSERPVCHALTGIIQESLRWVSDGHEYLVHEVACRAAGAERCEFRINKKPINSGAFGGES
jgi:hypothetical protein